MNIDQTSINQINTAIIKALSGRDYAPDERRIDIAFHMTDWLNDLEAWREFCQDPASLKPEAVEELLMGFLIHVPAHIAAARKLMLGFAMEDVFQVGIFASDDE